MSPFAFLVPAFLAGLAAVLIPIVVHLRRRQRSQVVRFPSLMFLEKVPYQAEQRRQIQHWLLLLLRALAVVLLVGAFARPFFDRSELAAGIVTGPKELVVLVDRSWSMGAEDRWERALEAARAAVSALGPLDRASVVFFAHSAEVPVRATGDRQRLRTALDTARLSAQATRYGPGLRLAQTILEESDLPARELVLVTDFQRAGWTGDEGVRLPPGTVVTPVPVGEGPVENVSVAGVTLTRQRFSGSERLAPLARVTRRGGEGPLRVPAVLELDGREVERQEVVLPADGAAQVSFQPFVLTERHIRGTIRVGSDALPQDNVHHFVASPGEALGVLLLGEPGTAAGATRSALYVERALGITEEGGFDVLLRASDPTDADLSGRSVVLLHDRPFPSGAAGARLREFVDAGGGLVVATGERGTWPANQQDLFPGSLGAVRDPSDRGARLGEIDYGHAVFDIFSGPRSGDFTAARFFRTRALEPAPSEDGAVRVLARFDDGGVALAERRVGAGRVLVWTSTLDAYWNDLALQPVFLPFVHQLVRYASGRSDVVPSFVTGQVIDVSDARAMATAGLGELAGELETGERVVIAPSGEAVPLHDGEGPAYLPLDEQGFYELRPPGRQDVRPLAIAVNVDLAEADLTQMDPQELVAAITAAPGSGPGLLRGARDRALAREDQERRQGLWRFLLLAAFLVLIAETAVSNRITETARKRGSHA